ncbi:hypothetical protein DUI87_18760 [Hirundo rustica rustica]|uniref:Uncharacterized protein n=1 Tax=Hirundo rustica rustica TaxID=333673 RepID=A0A3M0JX65_HIRRU|nr:hypothetical protein DUI87_18760 [Hirundo rustica rustica]
MGPITKATVAVIKFALRVDKSFNQFFVPTLRAFEGFQFPLDTNQVLLIILAYLAFRDKVRLTWITAQTAAPETGNTVMEPDAAPETGNIAKGPDTAPHNRDAGRSPDPAPQPTSEMNHPNWVWVLVKEMGKMLKERIFPVVASLAPVGGKPSRCPGEGEPDGAAVEPTDVTTVQVPAELQGQSQPAAVAPVETKKYKVKSEHPGNKDKKGGPSQPAGESEVEFIIESLTYESLHNLQKDLARRGHEAYTAWLLWVWDLIGIGVQLDSSEARNLGPLTQDSGVNQDRIQRLREVAILEVLFGRGGQHNNDPDKVRYTGQMLWNLAPLRPSQYAIFIATINANNNREAVGSIANKLRNYESMISGPMQGQVSATVKELREEMREMREMRE